ncbi:MAG TPA: LytR C-terminal domain-containing protein [Gaiellaceae bacterium]
MDAPLTGGPDALIRPWRTATLVASLVAAVELILLVVAAVLLLAKPLSHAMQRHAEAAAFAPAKTLPAATKAKHVAPPSVAHLPRAKTHVFVLNGNGRAGAAATEAARLQARGYKIPGTGNAKRTDYATTVVMYKAAYRGEGLRLAHDMRVKVVGPLDGISTSSLHGAQLVILLGAR